MVGVNHLGTDLRVLLYLFQNGSESGWPIAGAADVGDRNIRIPLQCLDRLIEGSPRLAGKPRLDEIDDRLVVQTKRLERQRRHRHVGILMSILHFSDVTGNIID